MMISDNRVDMKGRSPLYFCRMSTSDIKGGFALDLSREIGRYGNELIRLRRHFHTNPELGFEEIQTAEYVANYLTDLGLEVKTGLGRTGVTGTLRGKGSGRTLLLRSDMDALPLQEETGLPFSSQNSGVMHACGHDAHMAMLLITAKILKEHKDLIPGNIRFAFQPNEENAGAEEMIHDGVLKEPDVDAAMALHLWSQLETGTAGLNAGPLMGASHHFFLTLYGNGGHGGMPSKATDLLLAASRIILDVQQIQTRDFDNLKPTIITFCSISGGISPIVFPRELSLKGSIRYLHEDSEEVEKRFEEYVAGICSLTGCTYKLDIIVSNRLLSNDPGMTDMATGVLENIFGPQKICRDMRMMVGEDFAEFARRVPSVFYFVGTGNKEKGTDHPHHSPLFNIDEDSLPLGVECHLRNTFKFFEIP